jgi:hypothetical protein
MARVKRGLVEVYDVIKKILESQPVGEEIEIVFEKTEIRRLLQIKGDKLYVLLSYESRPTKLFVNGNVVRDDIKPIPKGMVSDIESMLYWNSKKFKFRKYKDLMTGNIVFTIKVGE